MSDGEQGAGQARFQAIFALAGAVLYPTWGLLCGVLVPGSHNDLPGRLVVAALFVAVSAAITWRPGVAARAEWWVAAACVALIGHYNYLVALNGSSAFYVAGVFVTLGAIDACFRDVRALALFSVPAVLSAVPIALMAPGGDPIGVVLLAGLAMQQALFALSVRARAQLERELVAQNERLLELDRLKGELVASVSHELRTPLHAIRAYTEILEEELAEDLTADHALYLGRIGESARRLQGQIDDLLDVARLEGGALKMRLEMMDPAEVASAVYGTLSPQAQAKGIVLDVAVAPGTAPVLADEERIDQVALNLVGNAVKFTPAGGEVKLAVRGDGGGVRFEVRDTGPGIAPAEQALIFEKFYQSTSGETRHKGGAGLGLAIARAIVAAHGGRIGVESQPGAGAIFWFWLPATPPPPGS